MKKNKIIGYKYQVFDKTTGFVFTNTNSLKEAKKEIEDFNGPRRENGLPTREFTIVKAPIIGFLYVS